MQEYISAETLSRKTKALKHVDKLLAKIDKQGYAFVPLNCTGVTFHVERGDALYLKLRTIQAQLNEELNSYKIIREVRLKDRTSPVLLKAK